MNSGAAIFIIGLGLGLMTAIVTAITTVIQILVTGHLADKRQKDDWRRQDVVAERVAAVVATTEKAADTAQKTLEIATTTHALVNSDFTKVKMALLAALELVLHKETITPERIGETEEQIKQLHAELNKRAETLENITR
jgi:hypothetical protein